MNVLTGFGPCVEALRAAHCISAVVNGATVALSLYDGSVKLADLGGSESSPSVRVASVVPNTDMTLQSSLDFDSSGLSLQKFVEGLNYTFTTSGNAR
jgi:hypothetical protein